MFNVKIKQTVDNMDKFQTACESLINKRVLIGIDDPYLAPAAYNLEYGDPYENIPPQPFLIPAVEAYLNDDVKILGQAITEIMNVQSSNNPTLVINYALDQIGENSAENVRYHFDKVVCKNDSEHEAIERAINYKVEDD